MKVFVDFDDVLFNAKEFKKELIGVFGEQGITEEIFQESKYWDDEYNFQKQVEFLGEKYGIDEEQIKKNVENLLADLTEYVFEDVVSFLKRVGKENLFLVSYGRQDFQKSKIKGSGLGDYFQEVIVTKEKARTILNIIEKNNFKEENIYFLDDRVEYINEVKIKNPEIKTVLVKRNEGRYFDEKSEKCDFEIGKLEDFFNLVV